MDTYTHEQIDKLLAEIDHLARLYDPIEFGLPVYKREVMDGMRMVVITRLGLTIMEDERILTIQKHIGCTRAQAQSLIDSGEF